MIPPGHSVLPSYYCVLLTQVSDLVWELNWGTHSADKQPFYKKPKPLQTQKLGSFLDQFLSLVFQVVTDNVSPTTKQKEGYKLVSETHVQADTAG